MRGVVLALLLSGCGADLPAREQPTVDVRTWLEGKPGKGGGVLVVQARFDPSGSVSFPQPVAEGLTFVPDGPPRTERVGEREVVTQRYLFRGRSGSYEIPPLVLGWTGPEGAEAEALSSPLFVDVGVPPPEVGELADIDEPPRVWTIPWTPVLAVGGAALLLLGGVAVAFRGGPRRQEAEVPPESPDVLALRAWEAVRADASLDDEEKAKAIARIFRDYAEAALGFEATAWTSSEIVAHLQGMTHLPEGNVPRARRLLRATDRIKFAEARPGGDLFDDLDSDLRAFVGSTRFRGWTDERPGGAR